MSETMSITNERYYSACEFTPSALIDNDITTTPNTNEKNKISLQQKDQNSSNMVISAAENSNEKGTNDTDDKKDPASVITNVNVIEAHEDQNGDSSSKLNKQQSVQKTVSNTMKSNDNKRPAILNHNSQRNNSQRSVKKERRNFTIQNEKTSPSSASKSHNLHARRAPSLRRVQLKRSSTVTRSMRMRRQVEFASTSNPISSNDPTDMEADLPPIKSQGFPWIPGPTGPPRLIHASLVPLPKNNLSSSDIIHTNPSIQIDKTSRSILRSIVNLMSSESSNSTKKTKVNKEEQEDFPERQEERDSLEINPGNRASQIFRRKLLEQSLAMSFNVSLINSTLQTQQRPPIRKKTRKGSNARIEDREARRERRERRRKEREEKERIEKEKVEKEREEKKIEAESSKDDKKLENEDVMKDQKKSVVMSKILDSDELGKIVDAQIKKKDTLIYPQPPLRRKTNESVTPPDPNLINSLQPPLRRKTNESVTPPDSNLINSLQPPPRRKTNESITPPDSNLTQRTKSNSSVVSNIPNSHIVRPRESQLPFPTHLSPKKGPLVEGRKLYAGSPHIYLINSATTTPSDELDIAADFTKPIIDNDKETKNNVDKENVSEDRVTSPTTTPVSSIPVPTTSRYNRLGLGLFGLFNKREQSNQPSRPSTPLSPKSPKSSSNFPVSPKSPKSPTFSPKSPKSPIRSSTASFSSFLPRHSRPSSPNPSTSPSSSSRTSQLSSQLANLTNLRTSKSSQSTSQNPKILCFPTPGQASTAAYSSRSNSPKSRPVTPNPSKSRPVTPNPSKSRPVTPNPLKSRPVTPNPLKSRPVTPNLQSPPRTPLSPKFSMPVSPVSPKSSSRPLSPIKNTGKNSKLLLPGFSRQTAPAINPSTVSTTTETEKLRKMQKFEEIIAKTEANNKNVPKNTRTGKMRAFKTAKPMTTMATPVSPVINSVIRNHSTASSSVTLTETIDNDGDEVVKMSLKSENIIRDSADSDIVHYYPDEKENFGQSSTDDDGVIRFTLTPAVCR